MDIKTHIKENVNTLNVHIFNQLWCTLHLSHQILTSIITIHSSTTDSLHHHLRLQQLIQRGIQTTLQILYLMEVQQGFMELIHMLILILILLLLILNLNNNNLLLVVLWLFGESQTVSFTVTVTLILITMNAPCNRCLLLMKELLLSLRLDLLLLKIAMFMTLNAVLTMLVWIFISD